MEQWATQMKYLTANGKIIEGCTPQEVLECLKSSSPMDARLEFSSFLDVFKLRINLFYGLSLDGEGYVQILSKLEEVGFLIQLE